MLILLVEDHEDTSRAMATLLRFSGHEVLVAASGQEALELHTNDTRPIDCAVVDLGLPDTTGTELMRSLLQIRKVPGIALTGSTAPADIAECVAAGFSLHMPKPVAIEDLEAALAKVAGGRPK